MRSRKLRQNQEAARRIIKAKDRAVAKEEGALKDKLRASDACKARSKPLSIDSRRVLREEERSKNPTTGLSDFSRNKNKDSPNIVNLPKPQDRDKVMALAHAEYRPTPETNPYWESTQQQ